MSREGERLWNIALYIRLSREDGESESLSVANQRKLLHEFVEEKFDGARGQVREYTDDGATGTDHDRPAFQRLLGDVKAGSVNCVICKTLSRAFRNYSDQGYFLEDFFPRHGVRFITLGDPKIDSFLQPETVAGYEIPISGIMNDRYAGRTSMDVRRTFDMKRRRGEFIGAFAPYGYRKDPENKNRLLVEETAAQTVREIFALTLAGESRRSIVRRLNAIGTPTPTDHKRACGMDYRNPKAEGGTGLWSERTVSAILQNPVYMGTMVQGRQRVVSYKVHKRFAPPREEWFVVPDRHAAIVSKEDFQQVQMLLPKGNKGEACGKHLLSGLVFCGICGKSMSHNRAGGYSYYRCRTRKEWGSCPGLPVRADKLEGAVLKLLQEQVGKLRCWDTLERKAEQKEQIPKREKLLETQQKTLKRLRDLADGLYPDWKEGRISWEEYCRLKDSFALQRRRAQERMAALQEGTDQDRRREREDGYQKDILERKTVPRLERELLEKTVERIVVWNSARVEVCLAFRES